MRRLSLDGGRLRRRDVIDVARRRATVVLGERARSSMLQARSLVEGVVLRNEVVYGVTTGFGAMATTTIPPEQVEDLQYRLLRSHAAGVGEPLDDEVVRVMLLLRARTLSQGYSGVRPIVVERLLDLLNNDALPVVPRFGSVGASGDLAPFAHLALPLVGEGRLKWRGEDAPASEILPRVGIEPLALSAKEGLSLLNGTEGMLAIGILALDMAETLVDTADAACALSVEALLATSTPFEERIHALRPHPGQSASARRILGFIDGSEIVASHADDMTHAVQDAYSLRCAPQVHGAVRDVLADAAAVFDRELGSVVDNPIVFPSDGDVVSGGNFHGQPLAFALDFLAMAVTELASISERRTDRMLDPGRSSGLTPFLATSPGLDSGMMLAQYTAAALVAECRVLSNPASIDSIPTSGLQEDHVSMGFGAGNKLLSVLDLARRVLAIELMCGAQGVDQRAPLSPAPGTDEIRQIIRSKVPPLVEDRPIGSDIEAIAALLAADRFRQRNQ